MKSERRHELRENDLAHVLEQARDYMEENGGRIGLVVLAVVAVVAFATFSMRSRAAAVEELWRQRTELKFDDPEVGRQSLERLQVLIKSAGDRSFVLQSLIDVGNQSLRLSQLAPAPPDPTFNNMAEQAFTELKRQFPTNPIAVGTSLCGLTTVEENRFLLDRNSSHKKAAYDYLTQVIDSPDLAGMPFQSEAVERRNTLDSRFVLVRTENPPPPPPPPTADVEVDQADPAPAAETTKKDPAQP